jgi:hypothetical protein
LIEAVVSSLSTRLLEDDFSDWSSSWVVEAEAETHLNYLKDDACLDITTSKGLTLWYKEPFSGNVNITYEACVLGEDRVSDLNCFWMASDPAHPTDLFARMDFRNGVFGRYYSLKLYYMGYGGNSNTTTRFRRYDGQYEAFSTEGKRPEILVEYTDSTHLIKAGHWYTIELSVQNGRVRYILNGEVLVDYIDPDPLTYGWFGLRFTQNHVQVRRFRAYAI